MLEFLLRRDGDDALRDGENTLDEMAAGGMYDQLGGGFHRYSVDDRWLVPHFEKMLYDNALLASDVPARLARDRRTSATATSPALAFVWFFSSMGSHVTIQITHWQNDF